MKFLHIDTLNYDWRDELLNEDTKDFKSRFDCRIVQLQSENLNTKTLMDSESHISCITESFYDLNIQKFSTHPTLSVVGTSVIGATGGRLVKLKKQVYAEFMLGNPFPMEFL